MAVAAVYRIAPSCPWQEACSTQMLDSAENCKNIRFSWFSKYNATSRTHGRKE